MHLLSSEIELTTVATGSELFHFSNAPDKLVKDGIFKPEYSRHEGAFYFGLGRTTIANCSVAVAQDLTLYSVSMTAMRELRRLLGTEYWQNAHLIGINGRIADTPDPCVEDGHGGYVPEVALFPGSLALLGTIKKL